MLSSACNHLSDAMVSLLGKYDGAADTVYISVILHVLEHELSALPHHQTLTQLVLDLAWFDDS